MSPRAPEMSDRLHDYVLTQGLREHPVLRELRELTDALPEASMRSSAEQAQLLAFLIELIGGHAASWRSVASPAMARSPWRWRCRPAAEWSRSTSTTTGRRSAAATGRRRASRSGSSCGSGWRWTGWTGCATRAAVFDLAYVDADKKLYDDYYERALALVRPGGVVALDNVLWGGAVADPADDDRQTLVLARAQREDPRRRAGQLVAAAGRRRPDPGPQALTGLSCWPCARPGPAGPAGRSRPRRGSASCRPRSWACR